VVFPYRMRFAGMLLIGIVSLCLGIWIGLGDAYEVVIVQVVGWIAAAIGVGLVAWFAKRLVWRRPILSISTRGIEDHASLLSAGFVQWNEVAQLRLWVYTPPVRLGPSRPQRFLAVDLKDPEAFAATHRPRWLYGVNRRFRAPLIAIPLAFLPPTADLPEVLRQIRLRSDVPFAPELSEFAGLL
jgi:hypothetical protein